MAGSGMGWTDDIAACDALARPRGCQRQRAHRSPVGPPGREGLPSITIPAKAPKAVCGHVLFKRGEVMGSGGLLNLSDDGVCFKRNGLLSI